MKSKEFCRWQQDFTQWLFQHYDCVCYTLFFAKVEDGGRNASSKSSASFSVEQCIVIMPITEMP